MWGCCSFLFGLFSIFLIIGTFQSYLKYQIIDQKNKIESNPIDFPSVLFCNRRHKEPEYIRLRFNSYVYGNASQFMEKVIKGVSTCIRFNGKKHTDENSLRLLQSTIQGSAFGLRIVFQFDLDTVPELFVFIADNNVHATVLEIEDFFIKRSYETNIRISKNVIEKLPYPYNDCVKIDELTGKKRSDEFREVIGTNYTYRHLNCFELCSAKFLSGQCNCSIDGVYRREGKKSCLTKANYECLKTEGKKVPIELCYEKCPEKCVNNNFNIDSTSFLEYPVNNKSDVFKFNIFFNALEYTYHSQIPKTSLIDLISSIGGTLGLFMGLSLLSFIEFFDLLINVILTLVKR